MTPPPPARKKTATTSHQVYEDGLACFNAGNVARAMKLFNHALTLCTTTTSAAPILAQRAHARLNLHDLDAALEDATAALGLDKDNIVAGIVKVRTLYALHRYTDALTTLNAVPAAKGVETITTALKQRLKARLTEEAGEWDWGALLIEAEKVRWNSQGLDRATYTGPIEVRKMDGVGGGRGIFLTRDVKPGELLLVEKAMAVAVPLAGKVQELKDLHDQLSVSLVKKLRGDGEARAAFAGLYAGQNAGEEEVTGRDLCEDRNAVRRRLNHNCFAFEWVSRDQHLAFLENEGRVKTERENPDCCIGVWRVASCANHSCLPDVQRSFLGDLIILRAVRDLKRGEEVRLSYIPLLEQLEERKKWLGEFGFKCTCGHCCSQRKDGPDVAEKRVKILKWMEESFVKAQRIDLVTFNEELDRLEETYANCPTAIVPRYALNYPVCSIISALHGEIDLERSCFDLGMRLLRGLGWELAVTNAGVMVERWGIIADEVLFVMGNMWTSIGSIRSKNVVRQWEELLRRAYEALVGENVSFARAYGGCEPELREGQGKDQEIDSIAEKSLGQMSLEA